MLQASQELEKLYSSIVDRRILDELAVRRGVLEERIASAETEQELGDIREGLNKIIGLFGKWRNDWITREYLRPHFAPAYELRDLIDKKAQTLVRTKKVIGANEPIIEVLYSEPESTDERTQTRFRRAPEYARGSFEPDIKTTETVRTGAGNSRVTFQELLEYYHSKGLVGEESTAIIQTLGAINLMGFGIKSLSGSGKSYTLDMLFDLIPEGMVYRMELSSNAAEMYNAEKINHSKIIYIPELQKAMGSKNPILVEVLKNITEGKSARRLVRDQSARTNLEQIISGEQGVIFTLAVENAFDYDTEFSRRVFLLQTDVSRRQTDDILQSKAGRRHANKYTQSSQVLYSLREHMRACIEFPETEFENPFAEYISQRIPRNIRARTYIDYFFDLIEACAKFNYQNRITIERPGGRNIMFVDLEDVYNIKELYWPEFIKSLMSVPIFGEETLDILKNKNGATAQKVYEELKEIQPSFTFAYTESVLEGLVDSGFATKNDYKTRSPVYSFKQGISSEEFDWRACWESGMAYVAHYYPILAEAWAGKQATVDGVFVTNHHAEQINLVPNNKLLPMPRGV